MDSVPSVAVAPAPAQAGCRAADRIPAPGAIGDARRATVCLLNRRRARRGLARLRGDALLRRAAKRHSLDMVRRDYFDHVSPGGSTLTDRLLGAGFGLRARASWVAGENLAWGMGSSATPRAIVRMWMNSPPHRRNVLGPRFRRVGIGIALGAPQPVAGRAATYTAVFGG